MVKMHVPETVRSFLRLQDSLFIEGYITSPLKEIGPVHFCFSVPDDI
jgi:hypothetical protein